MSNSNSVQINIDEAQYFSDLHGIKKDLEDTMRLCHCLQTHSDSDDFDPDFVDAFTTAILIRYARSFITGVRSKVDCAAFDLLTDDEKKDHEKYKVFRDKHIAHSVNTFEQNRLTVYYDKETLEEKGVYDISVHHYRVVGLSPKDIDKIIILCQKWLTFINDKIKIEKAKVINIVQRIPKKEIIQLEGKLEPFVDEDTIHKRR